jgi:hypothetical protein
MIKVNQLNGLRTFSPVCHGQLEGLDYRSPRPMSAWRNDKLVESVKDWLSLDPPRLELATLALDELQKRPRQKNKALKEVIAAFSSTGIKPISWLAEARDVARKTLRRSPGSKYRGHVYAILRWGYVKGSPYGVYVGETRKSVENRYIEHRRGINSGKGLPKHGIEPLYSLFVWANPFPGADQRRLEAKLHCALEDVVVNVTGNTYPEFCSET